MEKKIGTGLLCLWFMTVLSISAFATTYTVTDGYFTSKTIDNDDTLIMTGGGGNLIWGRDNSILEIQNTSSPYVSGVNGIDTIRLWENSQLHFSKGSLRYLEATGNAFVILTGGQIDEINVAYYSSPDNPEHVKIYCQSGWTYQGQYLSGLWLDDTPFNIRLYSQGASSDVFKNVTIIPEPATLALLRLGSLLIHKRR